MFSMGFFQVSDINGISGVYYMWRLAEEKAES
jgi:hypothetical protein